MATLGRLMTASLKRIVVIGSNSPIDQEDAEDFIFDLNNWMAMLAARGINLGYTVVDSTDDPITVPDGAILGMVENMAIKVAPDFGAIPSNDLVRNAKESLGVMRHLGVSKHITFFPSTLPRGSGNEGEGAFRVDHFYENRQAEILTEVNASISVEDNTEAA